VNERRLHALILCAAIIVFFHSVTSFPFLSWDDDINVTGNPLVFNATGAGLSELWRHAYANLYVPVAYTWFWLLARVSHFTLAANTLDPQVFHAGNLLLHAICTWLVYRIVSKLVASTRAAFVGALVFALHPLVTESVAWVTEARGLLSSVFAFTALDLWLSTASRDGRTSEELAHTRALPDDETSSGPSPTHHNFAIWRIAVATVCFVAAMLSKPQAAALPIVVLVLDAFWLKRPWKKSLPLVGGWMLLAAAVAVVSKLNQGDELLHYVPPLWARPIVALDALGFYTTKTLVPVGLTTDYGRTPAWLLASIGRAWPALVPVAVVILIACIRRVRTGWIIYAIFAAAMLPVLGLIAFAFQDISTVADRYAYPALLGLALGVALLCERVPKEMQWVIALVLGAGLGTLASKQAETWRSNEALFARVLAINPNSWKAEGNLGQAARHAKRLDEAVAHYRRAIELGPERWLIHQNLGMALGEQAKYVESEAELARALELKPDNVGAAAMLGSVRLQLGKFADAEAPLRQVAAAEPGRGDVHELLGTALLAQGKDEEAVTELSEALKTRDSAELRRNLGQAFMLKGDVKGAVGELRNVLKTKPGWPDAEIDLAWLLAAAPDDADRRPSEAMSLAVHAQSAAKVPSARFLDTLAAAEAATGRFEEAAKTAERALKLVPPEQSAYAGRIEKRRQAYAGNQAWRDLMR
jgi:tetratricopeptide (TPR) repeat protein